MADEPLNPGHPDEQETRSDGGSRGPSRPESPSGIHGKRLGDFELIRELGRGGMGIVYEARQISLNRHVALKVLPPGLGLTPEARIRFEREAHAAAKLHHTNIVPVHSFGEQDGYHFYAMDLVEGQPLNRVLDDLRGGHANLLLDETLTARPERQGQAAEQTPSPATTSGATTTGGREWFDTAARLVADVAEALDYAHGRGVIHRDIKPANLLFSLDGRLSIADFGLARVAQEPGMTVSGSLLGSPAYMSPEQIAAGRMKLDHRTDVYSLGAVLYEMLTLQHPFPGETREEVVTGILTKEPRAPRRVNPKVPRDVETICQKAMEKDPDRRYQTAGLFAQDLRRYLQRGLITARRAGPVTRMVKWVRRHPTGSLGVAAAFALALLGGVALQRGFGLTSANARRLVADAELHLKEGTYRAGVAKVDEALALMPDSLDAQKIKARLLLELHHDRELANLAKGILADHPDDWEAHAWLASTGGAAICTPCGYEGLADIPAREHVDAVERLAPNTAEAWRLKGRLADSSHEAVKSFDRALELDSGHYWALLGRAEAYIELEMFPEAIADAERAIVARPRSPRGRSLLAEVHARGLHDTERALVEFEKAIAIDPEDPITYFKRSEVKQNREKALEDLNKALELEEKSPSSHRTFPLVDRAFALVELGRNEEALADCRRALEIEPERPNTNLCLLVSLWSLGRLDDLRTALTDQRRRADLWADRKAAAYFFSSIADMYARLGDSSEAQAAADHAKELDSELFASDRMQQQEFGLATGTFPVEAARGKKVKFTSWIRTEKIVGSAQLWWRADGPNQAELAFENTLFKQQISGTRDWDQFSIEIAVPAETVNINFGVILYGWGKAWFDGLEITLDGKPFQDLDHFDLDFESDQVKGLWSPNSRTYRTVLDSNVARVGKQSLRLERVESEPNPNSIAGFLARAETEMSLEHWAEALVELDRYFAFGGSDVSARYLRISVLAHLGREGDALAMLDTAAREAKSAEDYMNLAIAFFNSGRLDGALLAIDEAIEREPTSASDDSASAWRRPAQRLLRASYLLHKPGHCDRVRDELRVTRDLPGVQGRRTIESRVWAMASLVCPEIFEPERAIDLAREAFQARWNQAYESTYRANWGAALYATGRYEEAKAVLVEGLDDSTSPVHYPGGILFADLLESDAMALFFLAMTESKVGGEADARRAYDRAVERMNETWPRSPDLVLLKEEAGKVLNAR